LNIQKGHLKFRPLEWTGLLTKYGGRIVKQTHSLTIPLYFQTCSSCTLTAGFSVSLPHLLAVGAPQDSLLYPLLITLFTSNLSLIVNPYKWMVLYAINRTNLFLVKSFIYYIHHEQLLQGTALSLLDYAPHPPVKFKLVHVIS
jgi:hypothetical protein